MSSTSAAGSDPSVPLNERQAYAEDGEGGREPSPGWEPFDPDLPDEPEPSEEEYSGAVRLRPVASIPDDASAAQYGDPSGGTVEQVAGIFNIDEGFSHLKVRLEKDYEPHFDPADDNVDYESPWFWTDDQDEAIDDVREAYNAADGLRLHLMRYDTDEGPATQVDTVDIGLTDALDRFDEDRILDEDEHLDEYWEPLGGDTDDTSGDAGDNTLESSDPQRRVLELNELTEYLDEDDLRMPGEGRYEFQAELIKEYNDGIDPDTGFPELDDRVDGAIGRDNYSEVNVYGDPWATERDGDEVEETASETMRKYLTADVDVPGSWLMPRILPASPGPSGDEESRPSDQDDYSIIKDVITSSAVHTIYTKLT